jgi:hypothetical protein
MYPTLKATVREGKIQLLEEIILPEHAILLVTVLDDITLEALTLGEHLIAGLQDMLLNRTIAVNTPEELERHLDTIFEET